MISSGGYDLLDIRDFSQTVINSLKRAPTGEIYLTGGQFHTLEGTGSGSESVPGTSDRID